MLSADSIPRRAPVRLWPVVLILLLAAAARFHDAAQRPVWTDEGFMAWITSDMTPGTVIDRIETWDRHPPLYVLWVGTWRAAAGDERIALRFWAIMNGLLSTALVYRIGADSFGVRAARYGALLFAVLNMAVYYAQEIRAYSTLVLAVCLMTLFFLRYLRRPRVALLVGYTLSVALMLYTVYLGLLVLAVQGAIALVWRATWRARLHLGIAVAAAVGLFAPWLIVILRQRDRVQGGIEGAPGTYETTLENVRILSEFLFGSQLALVGGLYLLGAWALLRGFISPQRTQRPQGFSLFFPIFSVSSVISVVHLYLVLAGGGLFVLLIVANLGVSVLAARTLVFLTPFLMLIAGVGLALLRARARFIFASLIVLLALGENQVIQPRMDYHVTAKTVAESFSPGDLVILETGWDDNPFSYELSLALPAGAEIVRTLPWVDPGSITPVVPQVAGSLQAHPRVWVVQWLQASQVIPWLETGDEGYRPVLDQDIPVGEQYTRLYPDLPTVRVVLFERPDLDAPPLIYGDVLALYDVLLTESIPAGSDLHVDLWWSAVEPPPLDYSVGVYLMAMDEDRVVAQHDASPGKLPTSQWTPGELVFDRHTLPADLAPGAYRVAVGAYWFDDPQPLDVNDAPFAVVGEVEVR